MNNEADKPNSPGSSNGNKNAPTAETGIAEEIVSIILEKALKKYKIERQRAEQIVWENIEKSPKLLNLLDSETSLKKIRKTRLFDELNHKSKQQIYYELRRYNKNQEQQEELIEALKEASKIAGNPQCKEIINQLVQTHVSTQERLAGREHFYNQLFRFIGEPRTIVDVGCGIHPMIFPFETQGKTITDYVALEKDGIAISALQVFADVMKDRGLKVFDWNIKQGWDTILEQTGIPMYDVAFLMKVLPVVARIERKLLDVLLKTPAKLWVITGSKVSMTKYVSIEKRERKFIHQFLERTEKKIIDEFNTDEEFAMIVE